MKALITNRGIISRSVNLLTGKSFGSDVELAEVSKPTVASHEILVQVCATALNPIDCKFIDFIGPANSIAGCDFAGVVVEVGAEANDKHKVGDRVAGFVQGGLTSEHGSFAEFVKAEKDLVWQVPEDVSDEAAATFGISAVTAMQALNLNLGIPWADEPTDHKQQDEESPILIYSGSTTVGLFALQLAKNAGYKVVTTASPHSFDLVKSYGADYVFDYRAPDAAQQIRKAFPKITKALDCISEGKSTSFCAEVLKGSGGQVITLLDSKASVPGVEVKMIMSFQLLGLGFAWLPPIGPKYEKSTTDREALVRFYAALPSLVAEIKAPPITVLEGGFESVLEGLDKLRAKKVSGTKLVVKY